MKHHKIGDLVWIPEKSFLTKMPTDLTAIEYTNYKVTTSPSVGLIISEFSEEAYCVLYEGEDWLIEKIETYEVPNVFQVSGG